MSQQINDYESNAIIQGNIATSVEIECFLTVCAVLGHQEAVRLDEEEPKDGEAVGQQPEHLPGAASCARNMACMESSTRVPTSTLLAPGLRPATAVAMLRPILDSVKISVSCVTRPSHRNSALWTHGMGQHWRQAPMHPMQTVILPVLPPG